MDEYQHLRESADDADVRPTTGLPARRTPPREVVAVDYVRSRLRQAISEIEADPVLSRRSNLALRVKHDLEDSLRRLDEIDAAIVDGSIR